MGAVHGDGAHVVSSVARNTKKASAGRSLLMQPPRRRDANVFKLNFLDGTDDDGFEVIEMPGSGFHFIFEDERDLNQNSEKSDEYFGQYYYFGGGDEQGSDENIYDYYPDTEDDTEVSTKSMTKASTVETTSVQPISTILCNNDSESSVTTAGTTLVPCVEPPIQNATMITDYPELVSSTPFNVSEPPLVTAQNETGVTLEVSFSTRAISTTSEPIVNVTVSNNETQDIPLNFSTTPFSAELTTSKQLETTTAEEAISWFSTVSGSDRETEVTGGDKTEEVTMLIFDTDSGELIEMPSTRQPSRTTSSEEFGSGAFITSNPKLISEWTEPEFETTAATKDWKDENETTVETTTRVTQAQTTTNETITMGDDSGNVSTVNLEALTSTETALTSSTSPPELGPVKSTIEESFTKGVILTTTAVMVQNETIKNITKYINGTLLPVANLNIANVRVSVYVPSLFSKKQLEILLQQGLQHALRSALLRQSNSIHITEMQRVVKMTNPVIKVWF